MIFELLVTLSESSELLLSSSIPDIQFNSTSVSVESNVGNFDSLSSDVLLLELSSQMSLDESGLSDTTISNQDELEFSNGSLSV